MATDLMRFMEGKELISQLTRTGKMAAKYVVYVKKD